jgi:hypothetical protein
MDGQLVKWKRYALEETKARKSFEKVNFGIKGYII